MSFKYVQTRFKLKGYVLLLYFTTHKFASVAFPRLNDGRSRRQVRLLLLYFTTHRFASVTFPMLNDSQSRRQVFIPQLLLSGSEWNTSKLSRTNEIQRDVLAMDRKGTVLFQRVTTKCLQVQRLKHNSDGNSEFSKRMGAQGECSATSLKIIETGQKNHTVLALESL